MIYQRSGSKRPTSAVSVLLALLVILPRQASAQAQVLDPGPACPDCKIELLLSTILHGDDLPGAPMSIVRTSTGRFFASFWPTGQEVQEYDETGAFVRILARQGNGPGEIRSARHLLLAPGDTLLVFDQGEVEVFDSDGEFVRSDRTPIPTVEDAVILQDGTMAVNAIHFSGNATPEPIHLVSGGAVRHSFGMEPEVEFNPVAPYLDLRHLTTDASGRIWSARLVAYEIKEWNKTGEVTGYWARDADWFEPWTSQAPIAPDSPPAPRLTAIEWLGEDRLMVLVSEPQDDWQNSLGPPTTLPDGRQVYQEVDYEGVFDSRIEIVDLSESEVVVSASSPGNITQILSPRFLAGYHQDDLGNPLVQIWEIRVIHP